MNYFYPHSLFYLGDNSHFLFFEIKSLPIPPRIMEDVYNYFELNLYTVRPPDTRPQAARTLQVHVFELGPKIFELNEFM